MLDSTPQKTVTIKLDGKDISVPEGATIWEAAQAQGTLIPHLCHSLSPGIARMAIAVPVWSKSRVSVFWPRLVSGQYKMEW